MTILSTIFGNSSDNGRRTQEVRFLASSRLCLLFLTFSCLVSCSEPDTLFRLRTDTGIEFQNYIEETTAYNILSYELVYNGGGIGVGDFNKDGWQDLYFTGNMIPNKLYLNKGDFQFEEVTEEAGVDAAQRWSTGVSVVDINLDGWPDLYVGAATIRTNGRRANMLFLNQGLNEDGIPTFVESAEQYGIADLGNTMHSAFFDYDNDGDLDLYVLTDELGVFSPNNYRLKVTDGSSPTTDQLYRNDLNESGTFTNVSKEAGIVIEGYGLGVSIIDINNDGWRDIYVSNDYLTNDLLYINQQDGTFRNEVRDYLKHQTHSAMGNDIADINNDGLPDIVTMDMLPFDNQRLKRMQLAPTYSNYVNNQRYGYEEQYIRNTLQLNQGNSPKGHPIFSEIGIMAGIHATDWSWGPLLADVDNDGYRDLIVSNGFPKDITNMDYATFRQSRSLAFDKEEIMAKIPEVKISNIAMKNEGGLHFTNQTDNWGLNKPSYSNGMVYADLDNDGDLDLVFNNINEKAFVYENRLYGGEQSPANGYLRLKLTGPEGNPEGLGSKIFVYTREGDLHYNEFSKTRGYISSVEPFIHVGIGESKAVDSIKIIWPDNSLQLVENPAINQLLELTYEASGRTDRASEAAQPLFTETNKRLGITFRHREQPFIDFNYQRLIPHQVSQRGPFMAVGDVDGNGEEDVFIGGPLKEFGTFLLQQNGTFVEREFVPSHEKLQEDMGSLLFDAEGDGDLDLFIASGSFEQAASLGGFQDRLYLNDGKGNFTHAPEALPEILMSSSCVKAADYDKDGDLDLFVGGMLVPTQYPLPASSVILRNDSESGTASFQQASPAEMTELGLVNDAIWTDFNGDGWEDLIVVGEWMAITFFENQQGQLRRIYPDLPSTGWWNAIAAADFDEDGDLDYVLGNHGINSVYRGSPKEPLTMLVADFDNNGQTEGLIGAYIPDEQGVRQLYPLCSKDELNNQLAFTKKEYLTYASFSNALLFELFSEDVMAGTDTVEATHMESSYLENLGNGEFRLHPLPLEAQLAPVFDLLALDANQDGHQDVLLIGNDFGNNPYWGYQDALNGLVLLGNGTAEFTPISYEESGFFVAGDGKSLALLQQKDGSSLIFAAQNQDSLRVFGLADR
ncbi:MAG: VCBS repeat-containing protein [Bacteroidota bacterium]